MYKSKLVSVVFATYRERGSVRAAIESFYVTKLVDEIIVVNNNAESGTDEEVKKTRATLIYEKRQGYGYAFQAGIKKAKGDLVILCEPDGTFLGSDLERFLIYSRDYDIVLGTRTGLSTHLSGADMGLLRKLANVIEAKTIEYMFNTNSLSDVGCSYKLFTKSTLRKFSKLWETHNSLFATELVLLTVTQNTNFVEIPVSFRHRVGKSTFTDTLYKMSKWGVKIYLFIFRFWIKWLLRLK